MPPKKAADPGKKAKEKAKQKVVDDKTFGLKNKNKSKTVQKYIKSVEKQVTQEKRRDLPPADKKEKEKEAEKAKLEASLFKPALVQQKAPVGVDPKSIVCEFFKKGLCTKGDKCKYSHNLDANRKTEKIDLYTDRRDINQIEENNKDSEEGEAKTKKEGGDTMEEWGSGKLKAVIETKRTKENRNLRTSIVCKYFLEAIENKKYGWFWECPNGGDKCQYMHSLPPGYVLKAKVEEKDDEEEEEIPLEEVIEEARNKLTARTPLTLEVFLKWREDKKQQREEAEKEKKIKREQDIKVGKTMRSGREMFEFNPDLFIDEEDVLDTEELEPEKEEDEPAIYLSADGTSISTKVVNPGENNDGAKVNEELFNEDEVPDVSDDDDDENDEEEENGKEEEEQ